MVDDAAAAGEPSPTTPSSAGSKRRHPSSSFRAPQNPPLKPSSETLFRVLCPSERINSIFPIIPHLTAKIRFDEPVPGSDDRVVIIAAEFHTKKEASASSEEASPAQRALLRVFERILGVEEEEAKEKEVEGPVVCRLLAPGSQVGCVLGKGGKIVEKIRQESGAQIRVFGKDQVPPCAAPGDELIHISGSFFAARKALLSVSSCLQDNPRLDAVNFAITRPFGATARGTGSPVQVDPYSQRMSSMHISDYHFKGHPSNLGVDTVASRHRKFIEEEVVFRMLCSHDRVGSIIGKGGVIVRALQNETGASIKVVDIVSDSDERVIVISARENTELKHSPAQDAVLRVHSRLAEAGNDKGSAVSARLLVPAQQIGCLLGVGGTIIAEMRKETGASIRIFVKEQVPKCAQANDEVVQVSGTFQAVQDALLQITSRIRETIFPVRPYTSVGMTHYSPGAPDFPPNVPRSRQEPTTPGRYPSIGLSLGAEPSFALSDTIDRQPALSRVVDHLRVDQPPFSYACQNTGPRPSIDRPSPRSWAPEVPGSGNQRGLPDGGAGSDFRGAIGSGNQINMSASMTTEVIIPQQYLGFIYGENGSDLDEIRKMSGAIVTIHDRKPGETIGTITIYGTPDQTKMAQSLLHAFIFCGLFPS
ncbi:KH domain-containing protein HEN4-like [Typha angustifolia]|uniref:KH domain-containing protein HEN4-like n=1 Tax=Typha angustifolia TaxID=59011 RepID=UPI003C2BFC3B